MTITVPTVVLVIPLTVFIMWAYIRLAVTVMAAAERRISPWLVRRFERRLTDLDCDPDEIAEHTVTYRRALEAAAHPFRHGQRRSDV